MATLAGDHIFEKRRNVKCRMLMMQLCWPSPSLTLLHICTRWHATPRAVDSFWAFGLLVKYYLIVEKIAMHSEFCIVCVGGNICWFFLYLFSTFVLTFSFYLLLLLLLLLL